MHVCLTKNVSVMFRFLLLGRLRQGPAGRKDPCLVPPGFMEELCSVHQWFWVEEEGGQQQGGPKENILSGCMEEASQRDRGGPRLQRPLGEGQVRLGLYWF